MSFNLTSSYAIIIKAGANANSTITSSLAALAKWCDEAEAQVCTLTRRDWITSSLAATGHFVQILDDLTSDLAAMKVICYDMSGYAKILEAQTILDVMRDNINRNLEVLKLQEYQEKMI